MNKFLENKLFIISVLVIMAIVLIALLGPIIIPYDSLEMDGAHILQGSSPEHILGTDNYGRDVLSRLIMGIRPTLVIALGGSAVAFLAGMCFGMTAGYFGGLAEQGIMRVMDIILCFPPIMLAMMVVSFWGSDVTTLLSVVGILYMPHFARIAYSATLQVRSLEYVESEISLGAATRRVLSKSIFPNILSPLIIQLSLTVSAAILLESGLSFLGIGITPPAPSWGQMIGEAKGYITIAPMYAFWPSFCLSITILATNLLGDSLRDILDPKLNASV